MECRVHKEEILINADNRWIWRKARYDRIDINRRHDENKFRVKWRQCLMIQAHAWGKRICGGVICEREIESK